MIFTARSMSSAVVCIVRPSCQVHPIWVLGLCISIGFNCILCFVPILGAISTAHPSRRTGHHRRKFIMQKQTFVQVIALSKVFSGESKKTGKPYTMQSAECVISDDAGSPPFVGSVQLPREQIGQIAPGHYVAEFGTYFDREHGRVAAMITSLHPQTASVRPPATSKAA